MSKRLALLIGNVRYQDGRLAAPVSGKEITALADVLRDPKVGQFDDVFVQINNTAVEVQLAIAEFFEESTSAHDTLLIYYAGQMLHYQGQPYLAQWDTFTEENVQATVMPAEYLKRRLSRSAARHKVVLIDCFVSNMLADGPALPKADDWLLSAFSGADIVTLTAVRPAVPESEKPMPSSFTPALLDGLANGGAAGNDDGVVTAKAWFDFAYSQSESSERHCTLTNETAAEKIIIAAATENKLIAPLAGTAVAAEASGSKKWAIVAVVVLLLLLIGGGGLYAGGFIGQTTAAEPTPDTDVAGVATIPATGTATSTAMPTTEPSDTPTPTNTAVATKPGIKETTATPETTSRTPTATAVANQTVTGTPSATSLPLGVSVVRQRVFMRTGPAINFRIEEYLDKGTAVTVLGRTTSGEWFNIELEDGRTGWIYSEMVESPPEEETEEVPVVATIPVAVNEFYDFSAGSTADGLTVSVGHVYVGTVGPNGTFQAELLPETNLITTDYVNGTDLGLGQFIVDFSRVAEGEYTSTAVRVCMVSPSGVEFFCETFPVRKEW